MLERPFRLSSADGVLRVEGAVDEHSIVRLRNEMADLGARGDLVVELSDVDMLPSVAIGVLARAAEQARREGRRLDLVAAPDTISQRVLLVCGLDYAHSVDEARDDAEDEPTG